MADTAWSARSRLSEAGRRCRTDRHQRALSAPEISAKDRLIGSRRTVLALRTARQLIDETAQPWAARVADMRSKWSDAEAERFVDRYAGDGHGRDLALR